MSLENRKLRYESFIKNKRLDEAKVLAEKYPDVIPKVETKSVEKKDGSQRSTTNKI